MLYRHNLWVLPPFKHKIKLFLSAYNYRIEERRKKRRRRNERKENSQLWDGKIVRSIFSSDRKKLGRSNQNFVYLKSLSNFFFSFFACCILSMNRFHHVVDANLISKTFESCQNWWVSRCDSILHAIYDVRSTAVTFNSIC